MEADYMAAVLPPSVRVLVRGWLNSNSVVMLSPGDNVLVDSGYCTHREQTLERLASREGLSSAWSTPIATPTTWEAMRRSRTSTAAASRFRRGK
jgi:hypothetical protein